MCEKNPVIKLVSFLFVCWLVLVRMPHSTNLTLTFWKNSIHPPQERGLNGTRGSTPFLFCQYVAIEWGFLPSFFPERIPFLPIEPNLMLLSTEYVKDASSGTSFSSWEKTVQVRLSLNRQRCHGILGSMRAHSL